MENDETVTDVELNITWTSVNDTMKGLEKINKYLYTYITIAHTHILQMLKNYSSKENWTDNKTHTKHFSKGF